MQRECKVDVKMLPNKNGSILHPLCTGLNDYTRGRAMENQTSEEQIKISVSAEMVRSKEFTCCTAHPCMLHTRYFYLVVLETPVQ